MPWYKFERYCEPKKELKEDLEKSLNELFDIAKYLMEYAEKPIEFHEVQRGVDITADRDGIKVKSNFI